MKSVVLIKPDAVERQLIGWIIAVFEQQRQTCKILQIRIDDMSRRVSGYENGGNGTTLCDAHYMEHIAKDFYPALKAHMLSGPVVAMLLEGDPADIRYIATELIRKSSVVRDLVSGPKNLMHASTVGDAVYEVDLWFPGAL